MKKARIEVRMSYEQKELLKLAAYYAGFNTLTGFIIHTMVNESNKIIKEHNENRKV